MFLFRFGVALVSSPMEKMPSSCCTMGLKIVSNLKRRIEKDEHPLRPNNGMLRSNICENSENGRCFKRPDLKIFRSQVGCPVLWKMYWHLAARWGSNCSADPTFLHKNTGSLRIHCANYSQMYLYNLYIYICSYMIFLDHLRSIYMILLACIILHLAGFQHVWFFSIAVHVLHPPWGPWESAGHRLLDLGEGRTPTSVAGGSTAVATVEAQFLMSIWLGVDALRYQRLIDSLGVEKSLPKPKLYPYSWKLEAKLKHENIWNHQIGWVCGHPNLVQSVTSGPPLRPVSRTMGHRRTKSLKASGDWNSWSFWSCFLFWTWT